MNPSLLSLLAHPVSRATGTFLTILLLILLLLIVTWPILLTLAVSIMLYAAMSPTVNMLVRRNITPSGSVAITMAIIVPILLGTGAFLFPLITAQVHQFSLRTGSVDERLIALLSHLNVWVQAYFDFSFNPEQMAESLINNISMRARSVSISMASYFNDVAFSLLLVPLITFFLLRDFRTLRNEAMQLLPNRYFELGWLVYNSTANQLQSYVRGISIQAFIMGTICTIGFWAFGIDYAPLLGMLAALLNLIPFFGISLAKIPPILVVLLSDQPDLLSAGLALGVVFAAQAVDSIFVMPHFIAKSANLHPLTVMLSVALAGYYFGFFGFILVVPILFSMKVMYTELLTGMRHFSPKVLQHEEG